jgi:arylsulfatase A-like enzyme
MSLNEYKPGTQFSGVIGRTVDQSSPAWPMPLRAEEGAPNVLFIILDDTGFGQIGCYGSPISTPNIDSLAANGLLYNNMHTTALCSPTRSCVLTGRNHHSNAMAGITEISTGYPGYDGYIPFENGFISEILQQKGYNTYAVGKWHLTPANEISGAGPYDRWPLGRGFERYYGFLGGDTHQYYPDLTSDNRSVRPPKTPEEGYHLTEDLVNVAISFIADAKQVAPNKPFFMYFCTGAMHAPHHVPKEWADKYKGWFDDGWEAYREKVLKKQKELGIIPQNAELSRHDPDVKPWSECSADEKKVYSRMMEVYAGFLSHTDYHIGRLLNFLKSIGEFDNTLIMVLADNGASAEGGPQGSINENLFFNNLPELLVDNLKMLDKIGGPETFNHYPWGWAWAGDTPFRRWKRETYRGGVSDAFIVHWPKGINSKGKIRTQYAHAIDMLPTVLEALKIEPPSMIRGVAQSPIQGVSLAHTFDDANAPTKHRTQYFEMLGHRAIYHDGWRAVCPWPGPSFAEAGKPFGMPISAEELTQLDAKSWELYHIEEDVTENRNVAEENRPRLIEMIAQWYVEAGKYNVLPVDGRGVQRMVENRPQIAAPRTRYVYYPDTQPITSEAAVRVLNRTHVITADVEMGDHPEGLLVSHGANDGGYALYVKAGKLHYAHNYVAKAIYHFESQKNVPAGRHKLRYEFEVTGKPEPAAGKGAPGKGKLYIDDELVGEMDIPVTIPIAIGLSGRFSVGEAPSAPLTPDYEGQFKFNGKIYSVTVDVSGETIEEDANAKMRTVMARQ